MLFVAGVLFSVVTACDKDYPGSDITSAGIIKDADGNEYNTIKIGTQIWTVENLKTTKYNDGTPIPNVTDADAWISSKTGAYCNYENLESNVAIYGRLYNWNAVNTGKLAPEGWHVPTKDDWTALENYLIANRYNYDGHKGGYEIAKSLCAKTNWELSSESGSPGNEPETNNSTGFTALPGGRRGYNGEFELIGKQGCWWSSTVNKGDSPYYWGILYVIGAFYKDWDTWKMNGVSVRLVKD